MEVVPTSLPGPLLMKPVMRGDARGFFIETYRREQLARLGVSDDFVQDNHSRSRHGVVRGMHLQPGQAKLVRCARGAIVDVLVDVRRGSPTFGEWEAFRLSEDDHHQLYCPDGFAHGFCVTSDVADVIYKVSAYYDANIERGFAYDDPEVGIGWPDISLRPSERDSRAPKLSEIVGELPFDSGTGRAPTP